MRHAFGRLALVALLLACSGNTAEQAVKPATDRNVITQAQFSGYHFNSAYDAVTTLRSNWLNTRGPDSFDSNRVSQVKVYLDNVLLGDVTTLQSVAMTNVVYLKHFDGVSASSRWGLGHAAGVIYVSTRPLGSDPDKHQ
jgi:hypothetical protein